MSSSSQAIPGPQGLLTSVQGLVAAAQAAEHELQAANARVESQALKIQQLKSETGRLQHMLADAEAENNLLRSRFDDYRSAIDGSIATGLDAFRNLVRSQDSTEDQLRRANVSIKRESAGSPPAEALDHADPHAPSPHRLLQPAPPPITPSPSAPPPSSATNPNNPSPSPASPTATNDDSVSRAFRQMRRPSPIPPYNPPHDPQHQSSHHPPYPRGPGRGRISKPAPPRQWRNSTWTADHLLRAAKFKRAVGAPLDRDDRRILAEAERKRRRREKRLVETESEKTGGEGGTGGKVYE
ncbi:MAG: hypothetical protein LQ350_003167 [Teloschistes chrysophthalmus]|nr:MAG: hypothetical protein LQ350_003167 [Niorma chrysophthalma]